MCLKQISPPETLIYGKRSLFSLGNRYIYTKVMLYLSVITQKGKMKNRNKADKN